jgi:poly(hydroxyalkanoate) depolymerase family esterase
MVPITFHRRLATGSPASAEAPAGVFESGRHVDRRGLRDYRLFVPPALGRCRVPLVVMLHGCTQTPEDFAAGTRMNDAALAHGFLVLYPAQCTGAHPSRCWNWYRPADRGRDAGEAGLLAALVRDVIARHRVDPSRVYVAGLSAGGAMAAVMGEAYPDLFAAVGVHSGLPPGLAHDALSALAAMRGGGAAREAATGEPAPGAPPLIVFHGDRDAVVHPSNGTRLVARAGRDARVPDGGWRIGRGRARARGTRGGAAKRAYTRLVRQDASGHVVTELWSVHGAGHAWSGGDARGSYTDPEGPSATEAMLRFFFSHTIHGPVRRPAPTWCGGRGIGAWWAEAAEAMCQAVARRLSRGARAATAASCPSGAARSRC